MNPQGTLSKVWGWFTVTQLWLKPHRCSRIRCLTSGHCILEQTFSGWESRVIPMNPPVSFLKRGITTPVWQSRGTVSSRRVTKDSLTTSRDLKCLGWTFSTLGDFPLRNFMTTSWLQFRWGTVHQGKVFQQDSGESIPYISWKHQSKFTARHLDCRQRIASHHEAPNGLPESAI